MNKGLYLNGGALLIAVIALVVTIALWTSSRSKTGYIQLHKVFAEFEMSKQYKAKLDAVVLARKNVLDSIELKLSAASRALQSQAKPEKDKIENFLYDKEIYIKKREQFEEDNKALEVQYNTEITKQLNQYIEDFGETNGYDYIYGAEGSGSLMYAQKSLNITDNVIMYVNERYKGKGM